MSKVRILSVIVGIIVSFTMLNSAFGGRIYAGCFNNCKKAYSDVNFCKHKCRCEEKCQEVNPQHVTKCIEGCMKDKI